jgi:hypothetical protein
LEKIRVKQFHKIGSRVRMPEVETLIRDPEVGPNLKILMLARDPRGVLMSRSGLYEPVSAVITRVKFLFVDFTRFAR